MSASLSLASSPRVMDFFSPEVQSTFRACSAHSTVGSLADFRANLDRRFGWALTGLEAHLQAAGAGAPRFLLAGGAALNAVHQWDERLGTAASDLDVFVLEGSGDAAQLKEAQDWYREQQARSALCVRDLEFPTTPRCVQRVNLARLCERLHAAFPPGDVLFANKKHVVMVWIKDVAHPIQLIPLPRNANATDLLRRFDQSCCGWAYDGAALWCTPQALEAMRTGINYANYNRFRRMKLYDSATSAARFVSRVRKMERKGFETRFKGVLPRGPDGARFDHTDTDAFPEPDAARMGGTLLPAYFGADIAQHRAVQEGLRAFHDCGPVTVNLAELQFRPFLGEDAQDLGVLERDLYAFDKLCVTPEKREGYRALLRRFLLKEAPAAVSTQADATSSSATEPAAAESAAPPSCASSSWIPTFSSLLPGYFGSSQ